MDVKESGVNMQQHSTVAAALGSADHGTVGNAGAVGAGPAIDPSVLAGLDMGLLKCLRKLGIPRQRICSACGLSYTEYDNIVELLRNTR
jgi:hypothetical protein